MRPVARAFQTESDGSYDLTNLRPGDYYVFAVFDTDLEYANPKVVEPFLAAAKKIKIEPRATLGRGAPIRGSKWRPGEA